MVTQVLVSAAWSRLLFSTLFLIVTWFVERITERDDMRPLLGIGIVLVLRDGIGLLVGTASPLHPPILLAGFTGAFLLLILWSGQFRTSNRSLVVASVGVGVAILLWLASPGTRGAVEYVLPLTLVTISFVAFVRIDRYVMPTAVEVEGMRVLVQLMLMVSGVAFLFFPVVSGITRNFLVALASIPFWTVVLALLARSIESLHQDIRVHRRNIEHIFDFLTKVGESLGRGSEPDSIVAAAVETIVGASGSDAGLGILERNHRFEVCAVNGVFPPPVAVPELVKSRTGALHRFLLNLRVDRYTPLWGAVLDTGESMLISDAETDPDLRDHAEDNQLHLKSVIILPLVIRREVLGLISIVRRENARPFNTSDLLRAESMAGFVALTLDNYYSYQSLVQAHQLERDLEIAGEIQNTFQAPRDLQRGSIEIAAMGRPLRGVSGDYYDVLEMPDGRTALVICDVSGKGVPAALVMMIIRTAAHLALSNAAGAGEILTMVNAAVCGSIEDDRFATVSVLVFDPLNGCVSLANAGHHPALIISAEGRSGVYEDADGLPVGIEADAVFPSRTIPFPPGSLAVLYTDGIVEAIDVVEAEYGEDRLRQTALTACAQSESLISARGLLNTLVAHVDAFTAAQPQQDDMTMVVIRSRGSG